MKIEWEGIPEKFWPDTEKPWRVAWGVGSFKDFARKEEAEALVKELGEDPGWPTPHIFNVIERTKEVRSIA